MSPTDHVGISWHDLTAQVARPDRWAEWAEREPVLVGVESPDELAWIVHRSGDVARGDELLGALVRLAAVDGGDDEDAALLIAHLLANGTRKIALGLRDLSPDIDALIAGELWLQIRGFPWRRRTRAYAKSLLLDTRLAVLAELRPYLSRAGEVRVVLTPLPADAARWLPSPVGSGRAVLDSHDRDDVRLVDVLEWARGLGTVTPDDVALLLDLLTASECLDDGSGMARRGVNTTTEVLAVAARHGVATKTIRRRRDQALAALRAVSSDYLAAVA